ncbi:MAG: hypothetical protein U9P14_02635 [Gemmatimonadota bacterium]|nr:hypothetical protein [Gemmatimonadota bacterium]
MKKHASIIARDFPGRSAAAGTLPSVLLKSLTMAVLVFACSYSSLFCQINGRKKVTPKEIFNPQTRLCFLDIHDEMIVNPFRTEDLTRGLISLLRSANYLIVRRETDVQAELKRNRALVPQIFDQELLARICDATRSDYTSFMRLICCEFRRDGGFGIPVLFHRNKVIARAVIDIALVEGKTGELSYSKRVESKVSMGRGVQVFPVSTDDPNLHLSLGQRMDLARRAMEKLARKTFEAMMSGIEKPQDWKYVCYWNDDIHIITDKPGVCPVCGSYLVRRKVRLGY